MKKKVFAAMIVIAFLVQTFLVAFTYAASPSEVEKVVFVHNASNAKAKPPAQNAGNYKLMGIKWGVSALPVQFAVNYEGSGIDAASVKYTILLAANEWDDGAYSQSEGLGWTGTSADLFANYEASTVPSTTVTMAGYDGTNEIFWGDLGISGTIAVTTVWYNRFTKQILEFDMEFNTYYTWTASPNGISGTMDLQNIATHELGHSVGLADLYQPSATKETMYGYSSYGDITKRDLYLGDQAGIKKLYG